MTAPRQARHGHPIWRLLVRWSIILGIVAGVATLLSFAFLDVPAILAKLAGNGRSHGLPPSLDSIVGVPDLSAATDVQQARSAADLVVIGGSLVGVDSTPSGTYFELQIQQERRTYLWAKALVNRPVAPRFFITAWLMGDSSTNTLEIEGLDVAFLLANTGSEYMIWNNGDNYTPWRPLPVKRLPGFNALGLLQVGRKVRVFLNSQLIDSLTLWSTPPSGRVGVFFKAHALYATPRFGRLSVYEF